jgi:hypothetical protein
MCVAGKNTKGQEDFEGLKAEELHCGTAEAKHCSKQQGEEEDRWPVGVEHAR